MSGATSDSCHPCVALLGTLDTKGEECGYLAERLRAEGCLVLLVDVGVFSDVPAGPDLVSAAQVAEAGGVDLNRLRSRHDRGEAVTAMGGAAAQLLAGLAASGTVDGVLGLGGSGGASIATAAMASLPVGMPKLLASTVVAGDTRSYVGTGDLTMMYTVVDIAGLNHVSSVVFANAAAAMAGMVRMARPEPAPWPPAIGTTMFGVTTACVDVMRSRLVELGYEVLVFHATGAGGRAFEALTRSGSFVGVADVTTTELADELGGGVCSAGPDRLVAAGERGIPQVLSLGALDMVNFGPLETVPERFRGRTLHVHNRNVTLMRTSVEECAELGRRLALKADTACGPVVIYAPRLGLSELSVPGGIFHDPAADDALYQSLRAQARSPLVQVVPVQASINDPSLAHTMADKMNQLCRSAGTGPAS